jgi:hypothetical protein
MRYIHPDRSAGPEPVILATASFSAEVDVATDAHDLVAAQSSQSPLLHTPGK